MTTTPIDDNPMNSSDRKSDDLTMIKGIGPARQKWLKQSLGVHTFQDLAAFSAVEIETQLRAEGQVVSRGEIEGWIVQAQELAAADLPSQPVMESVETEIGEEATSPTEEGEPPPQGVEEGEWRPFASFVVEFQARQIAGQAEEQRTKVHYMEADKGETWSGLVSERLCQWMLSQLSETMVQEEPKTVVQEKPETVEISQIRAFQPPQAKTPIGLGQAGQPFTSFIRGGQPFALEVSFSLTGAAATDLARRPVSYQAQFHAQSLSTRTSIHLGDTEPDTLVEGKLAYTARLPRVVLQSGMYRMQTLVTLQGVRVVPGHLEVPLLQVV